ncbi:response regulator [Patiriisocius hiemis]|uniref:Response regulator n=1 Tax=Patiriisocius hiemis TaxID=3075604 RepID=A0ABU2YA07_9FLAO|nr:response regulator [Constantimarinum sp. W242]MDT0555018.1 response regulator [Constantimarinum sp. W242]
MIIEDAYLESLILAQQLDRFGFNIVHLFKPEILFEEYDISRYDLILTDVSLVDSMDGYEVCRRIRQMNLNIPIIVRSFSMEFKSEIEKAYFYGATSTISKGAKIDELVIIINELCLEYKSDN